MGTRDVIRVRDAEVRLRVGLGAGRSQSTSPDLDVAWHLPSDQATASFALGVADKEVTRELTIKTRRNNPKLQPYIKHMLRRCQVQG